MGAIIRVLTPLHLAYRAPGDRCCLTSEGHRIQLCIDHGPISQIVGGCPLPVLYVVEKPGRIPEPLAVFNHKKLVGYEVGEGSGKLRTQNKHVCAVDL